MDGAPLHRIPLCLNHLRRLCTTLSRCRLENTVCIRVIKIRPSTTSDFSDTIVCDFSILDVDKGTLVGDGAASEPLDDRVYLGKPQRLPFGLVHNHMIVADRVQYQA